MRVGIILKSNNDTWSVALSVSVNLPAVHIISVTRTQRTHIFLTLIFWFSTQKKILNSSPASVAGKSPVFRVVDVTIKSLDCHRGKCLLTNWQLPNSHPEA